MDNNFYEQIKMSFMAASEEEIMATALNSISDFVDGSMGALTSSTDGLMYMLMGAKIGIASQTGALNEKEKKIVNEVFEGIWPKDMVELYSLLCEEMAEENYDWLYQVSEMPAAYHMLMYILAFAYIDGVWDSTASDQVEDAFCDVLDSMDPAKMQTE